MGSTTRVFSTFPPAALARVSEAVPGVEFVQIPGQGPLPDGLEAEVLLTPPWDAGNLADVLARGVRWVHTIGTGVDRLPFDVLGDRVLTCARGASAIPISEWILATMLAWEKSIPDVWLDDAPEHWSATQLGGLHGKTVGIVGLGGIGAQVARHALGFGMKVCAIRRTQAPSPVDGVKMVKDLPSLLASSDHVILTLPLTDATRDMLDRNALAAIPAEAGVHLVNVSRGGLIDQDALREALDDGRIACASLDVATPEPLPAGHWLYQHPKVRLSPHVSWNMPQAFALLLDTFIENLRRHRSGEPLLGLVDIDAGY